jgi:hypothetical protein
MMNDYLKVKDNDALLRDRKSNAIVNDSKYEYDKYMRLKRQKEDEMNRVNKIEDEVDAIKNDVNEIKNLLKSFIDKMQ